MNTPIEGLIHLEEFFILNVQNHYPHPSGDPPQSCSAVIRILGHEIDKHGEKIARTVEVRFQNFRLVESSKGELYELVVAPTLKGSTLHMDQPMSSLPLWQMVLTTLESDSYCIAYRDRSHAFLQPDADVSHKVGGRH